MSEQALKEKTLAEKVALPDPVSHPDYAAQRAARYRQALNNPNQFTNWFPAVMAAGVRYPETLVLMLPQQVSDLVMQENEALFVQSAYVLELVARIQAQMDLWGVDQVFVKNSLFSAKHDWVSTCLITRESDIAKQLMLMQYQWLCVSPEYATHLVIRKMIPTTPVFYAFNQMPVAQEFRLFVDERGVYAYQAYWPELSIRNPDREDWKARLKQISTPSESSLDNMIEMANAVMKQMPALAKGGWSVDFLFDQDGKPWLIDMALARQSYHSPEQVVLTQFFEQQGRF